LPVEDLCSQNEQQEYADGAHRNSDRRLRDQQVDDVTAARTRKDVIEGARR
jgi:hypothetical protein